MMMSRSPVMMLFLGKDKREIIEVSNAIKIDDYSLGERGVNVT